MKAAAVFLSGILFLTAETPARPRITGISHIALYSKDLQQSRSFYSDFLGFTELGQPSGKPGALTRDAKGNLSFEFRDPEKHLVEMIQYDGKGRFPGQQDSITVL